MKTERGVPMNYGWLEVPPGCTEQPWAARGQGHPGDSPGQGLQLTELTETGVLSPPPWVLGPQQRSWAAASSRRKDKTAFPALTVKFHPYRASLLIHSIGEREGMHREQRDITYFKTGILLCHYFMLYFMTNPSERTKTSLISSPSPVLSAPSPLCSIPLD